MNGTVRSMPHSFRRVRCPRRGDRRYGHGLYAGPLIGGDVYYMRAAA